MKPYAQRTPTPISTVVILALALVIVFTAIPNSLVALSAHPYAGTAGQDQPPDPCSLIPEGGTISTQNETTCVAQFGAEGGEKVVQIQLNVYNHDTNIQCEGLRQPSDYHEFLNDSSFGDCGIEVIVGYQGEPAPGYTGWALMYYHQGIYVRVATSQNHPANQGWVYDTAAAIQTLIDIELTEEAPVEETRALPPWLENDRVFIDRDWTVFEVPEWLDWIKPERVIRQRGMVKPWDKGGEIWVYNQTFDKWTGPIKGQAVLYSGDMVATGPNTSARVYFSNGEVSDAISVGSATLLEVPGLPEDYSSEHPYLWTLYNGVVKIKRALLREVPEYPDNPFIVRTMTCVAGSRGTEFIVASDPASRLDSIYLLSGELDTYNLASAGPEDAVLTAGNKLVIRQEDGAEFMGPYENSEAEDFASHHNLSGGDEVTSEILEVLLAENAGAGDVQENPTARSFPLVTTFLIGLTCLGAVGILGAIIVMIIVFARKKSPRQ